MFILPKFKIDIEKWKYNPNFEIFVSNKGHIKNRNKKDIAPKIGNDGYVKVFVYGSLNCYMSLHRVVMLTWKPTPEAEELTVDHLDHNKRNNTLENLEWVTLEENQRRAKEDFLCKENFLCEVKPKENDSRIKITDPRGNTTFISFTATNQELKEYCDIYLGRINNFSFKKFKEHFRNISLGINNSGYKKYCDFIFEKES
jgi:hypothetical protein